MLKCILMLVFPRIDLEVRSAVAQGGESLKNRPPNIRDFSSKSFVIFQLSASVFFFLCNQAFSLDRKNEQSRIWVIPFLFGT